MATVTHDREVGTERIFNFGAGPATLPEPVLEEVRRDLMSLPGVGMSILEISHRSKTFEEILGAADADIRRLAAIPSNYHILVVGGGASLQFSMVPMNLLAAVFDRIKQAGINVQETENVVFDGAKAAVARIHLNQAPSDEILRDIESSTRDILEVMLLPI